MDVLLFIPIALPVAGGAVYALLGWGRVRAWIGAAAAAALLGAGITIAVVVRTGPVTAVGGLLRADALTAVMLIVIGAVGLLATAASPAWLRAEITADRATVRTARRHSLLVQAFLAAMALAVLAANLGLLWVAIEATTIVTAFLVGQRRTRTAVEAAWKYVVICSVGISLALLGTILLNYASEHLASEHAGDAGLDLAALAASHGLDPGVTRIAVALLIVGFGTKAGLVPLHAWLPDAHSQAPAPVSALMSGVLLSVAVYAILRVKVISDAALGAGFARLLLIVISLVTLAVAASLLLRQRDYKRMLAYSSIEHMALLVLAAAVGTPLAMAALLLHMLGHGLAKGVLFLASGRLLQTTGTSRIADVRALAARQPVLAAAVGLGVLALIGFPPFSVFASELGIVRAGFGAGLGAVTAVALVLVLLIAAALVTHTSRMLLGEVPEGPGAATVPVRLPAGTAVPLLAGLIACAVLGVTLGPLADLLRLAAAIAAGGTP